MKHVTAFALLAITSTLLLMVRAEPVTADVSPGVEFDYDGREVRVKVYSRDVGDEKNHPIFKYGDLINRAIDYKNANPSTDVRIKFTIYKIGPEAYVGFDPAHSSYGYVKGNDHGGTHSEKLMYSIVKAAKNEVFIDFAYHKDSSGDVYGYVTGFLNDPTFTDPNKTVADYLNIEKVSWGNEAFQQMHAKFMTVSHYAGDGGQLIEDTVFLSTGNVDDHDNNGIPIGKDWVQSGILINGHSDLKSSFDTYFDLIYSNSGDQEDFQDAVRQQHASGALNYDDEHFSSFFYPIPLAPEGNYVYVPETGDGDPSNGNAWDPDFNAVAKYVDQMDSTSGNRYFKANVYHLKTDNFGEKLYSELEDIYNAPGSDVRHFRWVVRTNSYDHVFATSNFNNIGIIKYPSDTHAKDYLFALSGISEYYTITGSTNLKLDEYVSKANASVVVKEYDTSHPVYNAYKDIYNYQYQN